MTPILHGRIVRGHLHLSSDERRAYDMHLWTLDGKAVDIQILEHEDTRSEQANRYYWGHVLYRLERYSESGYTAEDFHDLMCDRFLTKRRFVMTNPKTGEMEEREIPQRSRKLTIRAFYRFVEQVRQFAAEFYGVVTDDPDPEYWRRTDEAA